MIKKIFRRFNKKTDLIRSVKPHPIYRANDLVLCEFPKSGITYLSALLINYHCEVLSCNRSVVHPNIFNVQSFIWDIHLGHQPPEFKFFDHYRLRKTHNFLGVGDYHCIYIYRNPFSVLQSYYDYMQRKDGVVYSSFNAFLTDPNVGVDALISHLEHVASSKNKKIIDVCYDKLIANPKDQLEKLLFVLGVDIDESALDRAAELSSIQVMGKSNEKYLDVSSAESFQFVASRKSADWENESAKLVFDKLNNSSQTVISRDFIFDCFEKCVI